MIDISRNRYTKIRWNPCDMFNNEYIYFYKLDSVYYIGIKTSEFIGITYFRSDDTIGIKKISETTNIREDSIKQFIEMASFMYDIVESFEYISKSSLINEINCLISENNRLSKIVGKDYSDEDVETYLYFMENKITNAIKIGISKSPKKRSQTLSSYEGSLEIIRTKKYKSRDIAMEHEQELHNKYKEKRTFGEWFKISREEVEGLEL